MKYCVTESINNRLSCEGSNIFHTRSLSKLASLNNWSMNSDSSIRQKCLCSSSVKDDSDWLENISGKINIKVSSCRYHRSRFSWHRIRSCNCSSMIIYDIALFGGSVNEHRHRIYRYQRVIYFKEIIIVTTNLICHSIHPSCFYFRYEKVHQCLL